MADTGVVILNYHGLSDTKACLNSLKSLIKKDAIFVYCINLEDETEATALSQEFTQNVEIIHSPENLGFSKANNLGINAALKDHRKYIMLLNNDTVVEEQFLKPLLHIASQKNVGLVCPKIYFYPGMETHKYIKKYQGAVIWYAGGIIDWANMLAFHKGVDEVDRNQFDQIEDTDFATGCCFVGKSQVFKEVGLLDDAFFLYFEDNDYSQRVKKAGYSITYQPQSRIWHKNAGSSGGAGSPIHRYYQTRNQLIFASRYAPLRTKLALHKQSLKKLLKGDTIERKAILDYYFHRWGRRYDR